MGPHPMQQQLAAGQKRSQLSPAEPAEPADDAPPRPAGCARPPSEGSCISAGTGGRGPGGVSTRQEPTHSKCRLGAGLCNRRQEAQAGLRLRRECRHGPTARGAGPGGRQPWQQQRQQLKQWGEAAHHSDVALVPATAVGGACSVCGVGGWEEQRAAVSAVDKTGASLQL
jgi:hypothetical protein